jgi:hypothetical protein
LPEGRRRNKAVLGATAAGVPPTEIVRDALLAAMTLTAVTDRYFADDPGAEP